MAEQGVGKARPDIYSGRNGDLQNVVVVVGLRQVDAMRLMVVLRQACMTCHSLTHFCRSFHTCSSVSVLQGTNVASDGIWLEWYLWGTAMRSGRITLQNHVPEPSPRRMLPQRSHPSMMP
jgi:hypothetical protein